MTDTRMDADRIWLERELELIESELVRIQYSEIKYASLVPVDYTGGPGIRSITYRVLDHIGEFEFIQDESDDLPTVDITRTEVTMNVYARGAGYRYTVDEVYAAQYEGFALETERINSVRLAYEQDAQRIAYFGKASHSMEGLFNSSQVDVVSTSTWFSTSASVDDMLAILNYAPRAIVGGSNQVEVPDTIAMAYDDYNIISTTPRSSTSDTTVLEYFLRTNPYIRNVEPVNELAASKSYGNLSKNRLVAYRRDPSKIKLRITQPLQFLPVQPKGLKFLRPAMYKIGGCQVKYPKSLIYLQAP